MNKRLEEILEYCKTYLEKETDNMDTIGICKRIVSIIEEPYDLMIRKIISVYKQRVHCMTIPSKFVKVMKIKPGDKLLLEYDCENNCMIVRKVEDEI